MRKNYFIEQLIKNELELIENIASLMYHKDSFVTLEQFGGGVDVEDNTPAMEAAIRAGGTIVCKPHGTYKFGNVVNAREVVKPKTIIGNGACFKNFCMEINLKPDTYDWTFGYDPDCLTIENLYFGSLSYYETDTNPTRPSIISGMPVVFKNCRLRGHYVLLAYINRYIDLLTIDNLILTCDVSRAPADIHNYNTIMFIMPDGTLVKKAPSTSAGDAWTFKSILIEPMKIPSEDDNQYSFIDLHNHNGVTFTNVIQARITVGSLTTAKFQSCHFETSNTGVLLNDDSSDSSLTFDNCYFYANCNYPLSGEKTVYNHCQFRIGNDSQGCYTKGMSIMRNAVCNECVMTGTYQRASSTDFTKPLTNNYLSIKDYSNFKITKGTYGVGSYEPAVFTGHVKVTAFLRNFDSDKYHYKKIVEELDCDEGGNSIWVSVSSYGSAIIDGYVETEDGTIYHGTLRWTAPVGMAQLIMIKSFMLGSGNIVANYVGKDKLTICDSMEIVESIPESTEQPNIYQVAPGILIDTTDTVKKLLDYIIVPSSSIAGIGSGY